MFIFSFFFIFQIHSAQALEYKNYWGTSQTIGTGGEASFGFDATGKPSVAYSSTGTLHNASLEYYLPPEEGDPTYNYVHINGGQVYATAPNGSVRSISQVTVDSNGNPFVALLDSGAGGIHVTGGHGNVYYSGSSLSLTANGTMLGLAFGQGNSLKYTTSSSSWNIQTIATDSSPMGIQLLYDGSDPVIFYRTSTYDLKVIKYKSATGWTTTTAVDNNSHAYTSADIYNGDVGIVYTLVKLSMLILQEEQQPL